MTVAVPAASEIMERMEVKLSRRKSPLKESPFLTIKNLAFGDLGAEQIPKILRASPSVHTYAMKDDRTRVHFLEVFCISNFPVTQLNSE